MTGNEYQKLALQTADTSDRWTLFVNGVLRISEEAGEVTDMYKEMKFQGHNYVTGDFIREVGDVLWYAAVILYALGFTMEDAMKMNIEKLQERYPEGFSIERSINRNVETK